MFSKLFGGSSKKEGEKKEAALYVGDASQLWYIEGKAYDLSKFAKAHPGECVCVCVCVCMY